MQFVLLLFVKSLHWLADDRVDLMERSPVITLKFHIRILCQSANSVEFSSGKSIEIKLSISYWIYIVL